MPRNSVRLRLLVLLLLLTLVPLGIFGYQTARTDETNSRDAAKTSLRAQAERTADAVSQTVSYYTSLAGYLASLDAIKKAINLDPFALVANPFDDQVQSLNAASPAITGVYLTKADGTFIHGGSLLEANTFGPASDLPPVVGNPSPLPQLVAAAAAGKAATHIIYSQQSPDPIGDLWIASRILDRGSVLGLVLLRVNATVLLTAPLMNAGPSSGISSQLVADNYIYDGSTLAAAKGGMLPVTSAAPAVPGLAAQVHGSLPPVGAVQDYRDPAGAFTGVAVPLPNLGLANWRIIARQPTAEIVAAGTTNRNNILVVIIITALALLLGITLTVTSFVVRPLVRMREAVGSIAQGRYDAVLPITTRDELGDLASEIETMRQGLKAEADSSRARAQQISTQVSGFTEALEPVAQGALYRRIPLVDDPNSPLLDAVEATNNLIRRFRRVVGGVQDAVSAVVASSALIRSHVVEAAQDADGQQAKLVDQRRLVTSMSRQAAAAGEAAGSTAEATQEVSARVQEGGLALQAVSVSSDGIRQRTLENTNRIKKLQDTAINLTGLVAQVQGMAGSLQLLAYNGTLNATRTGGGDPAFARMADETQSLAASFESSLTEIKTAVETAQRDIGAVILSGEAVAQDVISALRARDELTNVFSNLAEVVQVLSAAASSSQDKASEQTQLANAVRDGNDQVAQAYERIRTNLEGAVDEIAQRAADFERLASSVGDLQVEAPQGAALQVSPRSAA